MRILVVAHTFPLNPNHPNAHFMYDFVKGFISLDHQVFVSLPFHKDLKIKAFKGIKITTFRYIFPKNIHLLGYGQILENNRHVKWFIYPLLPLFLLFSIISLYKLVKKYKIDVINAHWIIPNGFTAAVVSKLTSKPLFISLAGTDVYVSKMNLLLKLMTRFAISQANRVIANSPQLLDDLGVDGDTISYPVPPNSGKRVANNHLVVAGAGRLVSHKGFDLLKSVEPKSKIISGLSYKEFRKKLLFVDIFVAPSLRDPKGNLDDANTVVLQAMAAGCAVVATDFPGYRQMIKSGHDGFLFPRGDKKALAKIISKLKRSSSLRHRLGEKARETVKRQFIPQKIAARYVKVFLESK